MIKCIEERFFMGKIVRALSEDGSMLCSAVNSTDIVRELARLHESSHAVTAALGRLATAASIMGAMLKYEGDRLTVRMNGGGACGTLTAVADYRGNVKCSVGNAQADAPDVETLIGGNGTLTVIKDMGLKEPYCGQIPLSSGNIAREITSYYSISEQLPTVCNMGTLFGDDGEVKAAMGYMVQIVPPVSDKAVSVLEDNLSKMAGISAMLEQRSDPEQVALSALEGLGGEILDSWEAVYHCDCSRERTEGILYSLGKKELARLIEEQEQTEVCCHFCNKKYRFSSEELARLLER